MNMFGLGVVFALVLVILLYTGYTTIKNRELEARAVYICKESGGIPVRGIGEYAVECIKQ